MPFSRLPLATLLHAIALLYISINWDVALCEDAYTDGVGSTPGRLALTTRGNMENRPRDALKQSQCQENLVCPGCIIVDRAAADSVLSGKCSPVPTQPTQEVYCSGHQLHRATAEQLQEDKCFALCTAEAEALCFSQSRALLQIGNPPKYSAANNLVVLPMYDEVCLAKPKACYFLLCFFLARALSSHIIASYLQVLFQGALLLQPLQYLFLIAHPSHNWRTAPAPRPMYLCILRSGDVEILCWTQTFITA